MVKMLRIILVVQQLYILQMLYLLFYHNVWYTEQMRKLRLRKVERLDQIIRTSKWHSWASKLELSTLFLSCPTAFTILSNAL